jgi:hypothetical protein
MEDALKRLDNLTNEEAHLAIAAILRATHTVDDRVKVVVDKVLDVGNAVRGVDAKVSNIDDGVKVVNDKVTVVIDGAQTVFRLLPKIDESIWCPRWKRGEGGCRPSKTFVVL